MCQHGIDVVGAFRSRWERITPRGIVPYEKFQDILRWDSALRHNGKCRIRIVLFWNNGECFVAIILPHKLSFASFILWWQEFIYNLSVQCISMIRILRIIYLESTFNNLQFSVLFQNVVIVLQGFGMNCECHILLSVATWKLMIENISWSFAK